MIDRMTLESQFRMQAADLGLAVEVLSDGPINASIAIVGEGPGESEVRHSKRLPFVGGSGKLLWDAVRKHTDRIHAYTTNVVKRQISLSRKGDERHIVRNDERDQWVGLLNWELSQLPNVRTILCLGNFALEALTEQHGIMHWRGSVLNRKLPNGKNGRIICTINPAYALRELKYEPVFGMDCAKFGMVINNKFSEHIIDHLINPTLKEALAFIRDLKRVNKPVGLDVEGINHEVVCYGLGNDPHKAMCINFRDNEKNRFTVGQEYDLLNAIQDLCDSHKIVAQNGGFDAYISWLKLSLVIRVWFDTLLAHHALYPQLPHSLAFLTAQYSTHPFYKDEGKQWAEGGDIDDYWRYNCKDVALTIHVQQRLARELKEQGMEKFFFEHVMRAQPHLVEATVHGVRVDLSLKERLIEQLQEDVAKHQERFHNLVHELTDDPDYYPNPNSNLQMRELYFNVLRLQGKGTSTDRENRDNILKHPTTSAGVKELIASVNTFKEEDKFLSTYAEAKVSQDGRFRTEYKQFGVSRAPGRLSSAALLTGEGGNMQNQPVRARAQYIADEDCVFVYFDLSQAESQVVSFRADIVKWKEQYAQAKKDGKYDAHRALASEMFKVPYDAVPVVDWDENLRPTIRYTAKRCRHGLNYRMERWKLAEVTKLPFHEAVRAFTLYHHITPELRKWWEQETLTFKKERVLFNAYGRRLKVIQRIDDDVLDSIIAFYSQSTIGDKITQAWYQCEEDDKWPVGRARIAIDVHDNLIAITTPNKAKTVMSIMKKYAESPIFIQDAWKRRPAEPLSIPCELKMSYPSVWDQKANGGKGDFVENPEGLHRWSHMKKVQL